MKSFTIFVLLVTNYFVSNTKHILASGLEVTPLYEVSCKQLGEAGYSSLRQFSKVHGIYGILCTLNNKIYVGSAVNLNKRLLNGHLDSLNNNTHRNRHLQRAWDKYNTEKFTFLILETVMFKEHLLSIEQYWMDLTKCYDIKYGYNICTKSHSRIGVSFTEESKLKLSKSLKNSNKFQKAIKSKSRALKISKSRKGQPSPLKGTTLPQEVKIKMSNAKKKWWLKNKNLFNGENNPMSGRSVYDVWVEKYGEVIADQKQREMINKRSGENSCRYGEKHSEKSKLKMSNAKKGYKHTKESKLKMSLSKIGKSVGGRPVLQFTLNGLFVKEYKSCKEASKVTNTNYTSICSCCNNKRKRAGEYKWKFKNENI